MLSAMADAIEWVLGVRRFYTTRLERTMSVDRLQQKPRYSEAPP